MIIIIIIIVISTKNLSFQEFIREKKTMKQTNKTREKKWSESCLSTVVVQ